MFLVSNHIQSWSSRCITIVRCACAGEAHNASPLMVLPCVSGCTAQQMLHAQVACAAHVEVMRKCRPGLMEYALEAVFLKDCYLLGGCRHAPYTPICASGPNGAVLHYGHAAAPNGGRL